MNSPTGHFIFGSFVDLENGQQQHGTCEMKQTVAAASRLWALYGGFPIAEYAWSSAMWRAAAPSIGSRRGSASGHGRRDAASIGDLP
ncbi:hypothetical protein Dimus_023265 [Dionaea muscipula]